MKNKLGLAALLLWVVTIAAFGYFFIRGWTSESSDRRTAIHLAPVERDLVLSEMRQMLHSVHNFVTGLSAGDRKIMEQAARASGMATAADVAQGADQATLLREFTGITARCVGCHTSYRLP